MLGELHHCPGAVDLDRSGSIENVTGLDLLLRPVPRHHDNLELSSTEKSSSRQIVLSPRPMETASQLGVRRVTFYSFLIDLNPVYFRMQKGRTANGGAKGNSESKPLAVLAPSKRNNFPRH